MKKITALLFTLIAISAVTISAQPGPPPGDHPHGPPSPEETTSMVFDQFDANQNDAIDRVELETALKTLHDKRPAPPDQRISSDEFLERDHRAPPIGSLFEKADLNNDGQLQEFELTALFYELEKQQKADRDQDPERRGPRKDPKD